jgi:hypothetical protein
VVLEINECANSEKELFDDIGIFTQFNRLKYKKLNSNFV